MLLGRREGRESARLLGGREVGCWVEETRRESAVLLGRREVDDGCAAGWEGQDCWEGERWTPRWEFCAAGQEKGCAPRRESAGLLGGREVDCWVEETRRESAVLLGRREVRCWVGGAGLRGGRDVDS